MVDQKHSLPGRNAGWVVAAIVGVVAVCAVAFMLAQRPQETIAVAHSAPWSKTVDRARQATSPMAGGDTRAGPNTPQGGADAGRLQPGPAHRAMDAGAAASNASAMDPAH